MLPGVHLSFGKSAEQRLSSLLSSLVNSMNANIANIIGIPKNKIPKMLMLFIFRPLCKLK
jgi:hypothetical protein